VGLEVNAKEMVYMHVSLQECRADHNIKMANKSPENIAYNSNKNFIHEEIKRR
jgi:hypothetical protein